MRVITTKEARQLDELAVSSRQLTPEALMEAAGAAVFHALERRFGNAEKSPSLAVLCGRGGNGGDGLCAARRWLASGRRATVYLFSKRESMEGASLLMLERYLAGNGRLVEITDEMAFEKARPQIVGHGALLDALLGAGLNRAVEGFMGRVVDAVQFEYTGPIIALDISTGLASDDSHPAGSYLNATVTLVIGAPKLCHVLEPAKSGCGEMEILDIGLPLDLLAASPSMRLLEAAGFSESLKRRSRIAHKGNFGHVLIIGGQRGKAGAPALAGIAALRAGAGLVSVAAPESICAQIAAHCAELMTVPLNEKDGAVAPDAVDRLAPLLASTDAVVCGMGLGTGVGAGTLVSYLGQALNVPLVLDADALNLYAGRAGALKGLNTPLILTPHAGEGGRLLQIGSAEAARHRLKHAVKLAELSGAVVVYKGHPSLIASPAGNLSFVPTGNPGMATAGAGDALAGIIGALVARKLALEEAAALGAYWHGLAGDLAAESQTEEGMTAGDLINALPAALKQLRKSI